MEKIAHLTMIDPFPGTVLNKALKLLNLSWHLLPGEPTDTCQM